MEEHSKDIVMEEVTDPSELERARKQRVQFDQNSAWLQEHISEVYLKHRGKCICVAGRELFVADTTKEAITLAGSAHPQDEGWFTRYIPSERVARIYAF